MSSFSWNYPVESARSRVADMLREKFPSDAQEDLRAELRGAYKAGGRNAVGVFLAGRVTPLKRRQVLAGIDHAEKLALEYRPSMRTVGKRAKRFALRNGSVPKFTARDIAHIEETGQRLDELDMNGEGDGPETIMTSLGYVDVWKDSSVTMHDVNYTLDELERVSKRKTLRGRVVRRKGKRSAAKNGRDRLKRTKRACAARGRATRKGSSKAASRLATHCKKRRSRKAR